MADREDVQMAIEWIKDPSRCAEFLTGLIQEFESLFTLDGGTDMKGGEWVTVETTKKYRCKLAVNLSSQIVLARKALTLCNEQRSDMFRLDPEWQSAFTNFEKTLIHRNVLGVVDRGAVPDAEEKLAKTFLGFRLVAENAIARISVSIAVSAAVQPVKKTQVKRRQNAGAEQKELSMSFHVFLSHNSKDKPDVKRLGEALKLRNLTVWFDEWELRPGLSWQDALEEIISNCKSAAVCVGENGIGPWEDPEMKALLRRFVAEKKTGNILPIIPVLLPGAPANVTLPLFLEEFTWVDLRDGLKRDGLDRLEWGITGVKPNPQADPSQQATPELGRAGSSANTGYKSNLVGNSRLVTDLERAIGQKLSIAKKFIGSCRQARDLEFCAIYDADELLDALKDSQYHFELAEINHGDFSGTSLAARRNAAAIVAVILRRFINPGTSLHRLILNVMNDILDGDENAPTTDITGEFECRLYAASQEGAHEVIHVLQNHEAGQSG